MVHLVGDMHQPLHCGDRSDRGGNSTPAYLLEVKGKPSNLHSIWDTAILKNVKAGERVAPYADRLNATISAEQASTWQGGNLIAWANEGHKTARDVVYPGVPTVAVEGEMITGEAAAIPVLDQAYVDRAKPVIEGQLMRGGMRLASVLNKAFAK